MPDRTHEHLHDDEELELPPLDGALEEETDEPIRDVELDQAPPLADDDGASFDFDPVAELTPLPDTSEEEPGIQPDPIDLRELADAIAFPDEMALATDERGLSEDVEEPSPFDLQTSLERGAGTGEDIADFVDEAALPPLGAPDDEDEAERASSPVQPDERQQTHFPKALEGSRYRVASGLGANVPCALLAVSPACIVVADPAMLIVHEGARVAPSDGVDADVVAIASTEEALIAVSSTGDLLASVDAGESWDRVGALSLQASERIGLSTTPGRVWIHQGSSLSSFRFRAPHRAEPQMVVRETGVRAVVAAGSSLVALVERSDRLWIERFRGDDEASEAVELPATLHDELIDAAPILAATAGGRAIALCSRDATFLSRDGGLTYRRIAMRLVHGAAFSGLSEDALLMVTVAFPDRPWALGWLVEIEPSDKPERVALIPRASVSRGVALAWDPTREVLWLASDAGLVAFVRDERH